MKWRIVGIVLLLASVLLASLLFLDVVVDEETRTLLDQSGIPVIYLWEAGEYSPIWAERNVTLTPMNTTLTPPDRPPSLKYTVTVLAKATVWNSSTTKESLIDFWIVNYTGRNRLIGFLENNTYPTTGWENRTQELPGIKAYAKGLDKSLIVKFLQGMDYNGNYTILMINPYKEFTSNVTVVVDETLTTRGHILMLSPIAAAPLLVLMLAPGVYLTIRNTYRLSKPSKRRKRPA